MQGASPVKRGVYDTPTIHGPWANACYTHMLQHSPKTSTLIRKRVIGYDPKPNCLYCGEPATHRDAFNHDCCDSCEEATDATATV